MIHSLAACAMILSHRCMASSTSGKRGAYRENGEWKLFEPPLDECHDHKTEVGAYFVCKAELRRKSQQEESVWIDVGLQVLSLGEF